MSTLKVLYFGEKYIYVYIEERRDLRGILENNMG